MEKGEKRSNFYRHEKETILEFEIISNIVFIGQMSDKQMINLSMYLITAFVTNALPSIPRIVESISFYNVFFKMKILYNKAHQNVKS